MEPLDLLPPGLFKHLVFWSSVAVIFGYICAGLFLLVAALAWLQQA